LRVGRDGLHAGAGAFAGGKISGSATGTIGGVGGTVRGEAWAGIGARANLDVGRDSRGRFHIGGSIGAGLGIGGQIGGEITIDPAEVKASAREGIRAIAGDRGVAVARNMYHGARNLLSHLW
jgi:hypothetical protein